MTIAQHDITGLVLAGGRGSRMGGVDKGLQPHRGVPLALHALRRLQPQVGAAMIIANRNRDAYAAFGVPVWPDAMPDFAGPLAGFAAGLAHCATPWLACVPCDTPNFPPDLVARLAAVAAEHDAEIVMPSSAEDGRWVAQPVFSLLRVSLQASLLRFLHDGGRKIDQWARQHRRLELRFDEARAFFNANTADDLRQLQP